MTFALRVTTVLKDQLRKLLAHLALTSQELAQQNVKSAPQATTAKRVRLSQSNARMVSVQLDQPNQLFVSMVLTVTKLLRSLKVQMTALSAPTAIIVTVASSRAFAMLGTSVTLVLLLGKMTARSVPKAITALQAHFSQPGAPKPFTGPVPVREMSPTANLVKQVTTASITTVYRVFALGVISAPLRPRSRFHAGKAHTTLTNVRKRPQTVNPAQLALPATVEVSMITCATCAHPVITAPKRDQKKIQFLALSELTGTQPVQSPSTNAGSALLATTANPARASQFLVMLVITVLPDQQFKSPVLQAPTAQP